MNAILALNDLFQSTPPVWEATQALAKQKREYEFQSTPPVWEATVQRPASCYSRFRISIHASRVGGDTIDDLERIRPYISIHASRVGGDSIAR